MNGFLERHNIDVGKTFGILLILVAIGEAYSIVFGLLYQGSFGLNLAIPIIAGLGIGMFNHRDASRLWCLAGLWLFLILMVLATLVTPFLNSGSTQLGSWTLNTPPLWKLILTDMLVAPAIWFGIKVLTSKKAKGEFGVAEQETDPALPDT